jgi:hypothetical protein
MNMRKLFFRLAPGVVLLGVFVSAQGEAVPETAAMALLGTGLAAAAARARRHRNRAIEAS